MKQMYLAVLGVFIALNGHCSVNTANCSLQFNKHKYVGNDVLEFGIAIECKKAIQQVTYINKNKPVCVEYISPGFPFERSPTQTVTRPPFGIEGKVKLDPYRKADIGCHSFGYDQILIQFKDYTIETIDDFNFLYFNFLYPYESIKEWNHNINPQFVNDSSILSITPKFTGRDKDGSRVYSVKYHISPEAAKAYAGVIFMGGPSEGQGECGSQGNRKINEEYFTDNASDLAHFINSKENIFLPACGESGLLVVRLITKGQNSLINEIVGNAYDWGRDTTDAFRLAKATQAQGSRIENNLPVIAPGPEAKDALAFVTMQRDLDPKSERVKHVISELLSTHRKLLTDEDVVCYFDYAGRYYCKKGEYIVNLVSNSKYASAYSLPDWFHQSDVRFILSHLALAPVNLAAAGFNIVASTTLSLVFEEPGGTNSALNRLENSVSIDMIEDPQNDSFTYTGSSSQWEEKGYLTFVENTKSGAQVRGIFLNVDHPNLVKDSAVEFDQDFRCAMTRCEKQ